MSTVSEPDRAALSPVATEHAALRDTLTKHCPSHVGEITIQTIGPENAGKSSLVITGTTALGTKMSIRTGLAHVRQGDPVTKNMSKQKVTPTIYLADFPGWPETPTKNYWEFVELLYQGRLKEFTDPLPFDGGYDKKHYAYDAWQSEREAMQRKPACVLIVVPAKRVDSDGANVQKARELCEKHGLPYMIVLTKIDSEDLPEVRINPENMEEHKAVNDMIEKISGSRSMGVPKFDIFPVISYCNERSRNQALELPILRALQHAVEKAEDWHEREERRISLLEGFTVSNY